MEPYGERLVSNDHPTCKDRPGKEDRARFRRPGYFSQFASGALRPPGNDNADPVPTDAAAPIAGAPANGDDGLEAGRGKARAAAVATILARVGGEERAARLCGVAGDALRKWREKGYIPPKNWPAIVHGSGGQVGYETLNALYQQAKPQRAPKPDAPG